MSLYIVTYEHRDETGWTAQLIPHIAWLQARLADDSLLASGPFKDGAVKSALLILDAPDRTAVEALIATDPYAEHGVIETMTVREWNPILGAFNGRSSIPR